jgi:hypothetical protein
MNDDYLFVVNQFVDHAIVADAQLEQPFKLSREGFVLDILKILRQPIHSLDNSPSYQLIEFGQFLCGRVQKANTIHILSQVPTASQSRLTTHRVGQRLRFFVGEATDP